MVDRERDEALAQRGAVGVVGAQHVPDARVALRLLEGHKGPRRRRRARVGRQRRGAARRVVGLAERARDSRVAAAVGDAAKDRAPELHPVRRECPRLVGEDVRHLTELLEQDHRAHARRLVLLLVVHGQVMRHEVAPKGEDDVARDVEADGDKRVAEQKVGERVEEPLAKAPGLGLAVPRLAVVVVADDDC
eukprot:6182067-Pleurochrysis_carterae.AAC.2